jgi:hypothetical protein
MSCVQYMTCICGLGLVTAHCMYMFFIFSVSGSAVMPLKVLIFKPWYCCMWTVHKNWTSGGKSRLKLNKALRRPGIKLGSSHVGFVVDKVELGQVISPSTSVSLACQSSFHQFLHNHHHLSSGAGTRD